MTNSLLPMGDWSVYWGREKAIHQGREDAVHWGREAIYWGGDAVCQEEAVCQGEAVHWEEAIWRERRPFVERGRRPFVEGGSLLRDTAVCRCGGKEEQWISMLGNSRFNIITWCWSLNRLRVAAHNWTLFTHLSLLKRSGTAFKTVPKLREVHRGMTTIVYNWATTTRQPQHAFSLTTYTLPRLTYIVTSSLASVSKGKLRVRLFLNQS